MYAFICHTSHYLNERWDCFVLRLVGAFLLSKPFHYYKYDVLND